MPLKKYRKKRDFKKTTEPYGDKKKSRKQERLFVVQKHAAKHLHYDFRLEYKGTLLSWAVPKGPSLDPANKRLAVHVEDHPLSYGDFEGTIPKGEYGGGSVMVWDLGTWEEETDNGYKNGILTFTLHGHKLKGKWKLIQIKQDPKNWLLIKVQDKYAKNKNDYDITVEKPLSVATGRNMDQIAKNTTPKNKKKTQKKSNTALIKKILKKFDLKKSKFPDTVKPQLATLVDKAPASDHWLHEIKYDGYRLLCHINQKIKMLTRGQLDWANKFKPLVADVEQLNLNETILDGELVAIDENKSSNFQQLQNAIHSQHTENLIYYVFDILYYEGYDLRALPLIERKKILKALLPKTDLAIQYSDHIIGNGQTVYEKACDLSYEGIISKEIQSPYLQKRTKNWLKVKCMGRQEFLVCGFTQAQGSRAYFGSLILGYYDNKNVLRYAGHVGTGFNATSLKEINTQLQKLKTKICPFKTAVKEPNLASWVKPKLVIEVEFREWTSEEILRHPSFKGIRLDKPAVNVNKEQNLSSMKITNPEKLLYPKQKITKGDVVQYYETASAFILPHLANRPLSILRCPNGWEQGCFYQKHIPNNQIKTLFTVDVKGSKGVEKYLYIKNKEALVQLGQMGVLELHPWGCLVDNVEKPDMIIFDLDPGVDVAWKMVIECAFVVKEELENLDLESFVKTTGGKGLHIQIPIQRRYTWEDILHFSKVFVQYLTQKYPTKYLDTMVKAKRKGKIFIDYLRNHRGATAISPYSLRARDKAPIAVPLAWDELTTRLTSDYFNLSNILRRLDKHDDPWQDFNKIKQTLPKGK